MTGNFLSLSAVLRRLNLPDSRVSALRAAGLLEPDAVAGRLQLFAPGRLAELRKSIAATSRSRPSTRSAK